MGAAVAILAAAPAVVAATKRNRPHMHDPVWVTKDGRRMLVGQMDDKHLRNSIAKIERSRNWRRHWLPRLYLELEIRKVKRALGNL